MIVMGDDLAGTGDDFVTEIKVEASLGITAPDGSPARRVLLTTERRGSGRLGHVEFMLSEAAAAKLAGMVNP